MIEADGRLDPMISSIYEPEVSALQRRLKLLMTAAHAAGIYTYVAHL